MSISTKCMLLSLRLGFWEGQRFDRQATQELTEQAQAEAGSARVNKHLIRKEAFKSLATARNAIRTHFYSETLPWRDNGDRVITRAAYMGFIEDHQALAEKFKQEALTFCRDVYPAEVDRASFRMGALFKRDDYPSPREVYRRFYVSLDIDPIAEASDFRVEMGEAETDRIRAQIEQANRDRLGSAMAHVWGQLADVVNRFAERTAASGTIRVEVTRSIQDVVAKLPALNIIDDPQLEEIRQLVEHKLGGYDAAELRSNTALRSKAADEAKAIADKMRGMMAAFGGGS